MARRPQPALAGAAAFAFLAWVVWAFAFRVDSTMAADGAALYGFTTLDDTPAAGLAERIATLANPAPYAVLCGIVLLHGLHGRGPRGAAAVMAIILGANVTTQELKPALAEPRTAALLEAGRRIDPVSWPSGHSTAAMALALCAILVAPVAVRWLVAVAGVLYAVGVAYSVVLLGWHLPSDALGGFCVAAAWTCLGIAVLRWAAERWPAGSGRAAAARAMRRLRPAVVWAGGVVMIAGVIVLGRVATTLPAGERQLAFLAGAVAIVALAAGLAGGLVALLGRR